MRDELAIADQTDEDEDESERVRLSVSSLVSTVNATRMFFVRIRPDLLKDIFACDYIFFSTSTSRLNRNTKGSLRDLRSTVLLHEIVKFCNSAAKDIHLFGTI